MADVSSLASQQNHSLAEVDRESCNVREQDQFMPIANVIRIMRKVLPAHAKISDDAKETTQECVSEFIGFITGEANDRCQKEQRKTVTAEDVLWAMSKLGFDDYVGLLSRYLQMYREIEGDHRASTLSESLPKNKGSILAESLPKKKQSALGILSPGIQMIQPGLYSSEVGYYRDVVTGEAIPFNTFSPYK